MNRRGQEAIRGEGFHLLASLMGTYQTVLCSQMESWLWQHWPCPHLLTPAANAQVILLPPAQSCFQCQLYMHVSYVHTHTSLPIPLGVEGTGKKSKDALCVCLELKG